jgi:hypothetical protein
VRTMTNVSTETNTRLGTKIRTRRDRYRTTRAHTLLATSLIIARRIPAPVTDTGTRPPLQWWN